MDGTPGAEGGVESGRTESSESPSGANSGAENGSAGVESDATGVQNGTSRRSIRVPYKFRRDSVQDDRERVPLFLMQETKSTEREALRELESRFDGDVSLTDLREAVVSVGLGRLDEVEDQLAEWGYGVTFEE